MPSSAPAGDLGRWARLPFSAGGLSHDYYRRGDGPGVVLVPEIPGITPEVLGLGEHLVDEGFTVVIPSLFGTPGRPVSPPYVAGVLARACVAAEFRAFAVGAARPVTGYLRALAAEVAAQTGSGKVGVIGMCFTGGFALAAALDPTVAASVMSQPSVPLPVTAARRRDVGLSPVEAAEVAARARDGGLCVLGLRFSEDGAAPPQRFAALRALLGDAFEVIELDSAPGNPSGFSRRAHSVLTGEVRETPGHPALGARQRVVEFLRERLGRGS